MNLRVCSSWRPSGPGRPGAAQRAPESTEPSFIEGSGAECLGCYFERQVPRAAPANTGFVIGDDGVAGHDASMSVDAEGNLGTETARQTLAAIRTITKLPVRFVINTHHHPTTPVGMRSS